MLGLGGGRRQWGRDKPGGVPEDFNDSGDGGAVDAVVPRARRGGRPAPSRRILRPRGEQSKWGARGRA